VKKLNLEHKAPDIVQPYSKAANASQISQQKQKLLLEPSSESSQEEAQESIR